MLDGRGRHGACLVNAVAGVQQPLDAHRLSSTARP
jgi:hypothetical protein